MHATNSSLRKISLEGTPFNQAAKPEVLSTAFAIHTNRKPPQVFWWSSGTELSPGNGEKHASIEGKNFTNHSLRAPGTTTLLDAGVPEALIQKWSGHRSTKALRMYERVTPDQDLAISHILHSSSKVLNEPASKPTTHTSQANFDPDASFSAEDLKIVNSISC